jgi:hypothetical protein
MKHPRSFEANPCGEDGSCRVLLALLTAGLLLMTLGMVGQGGLIWSSFSAGTLSVQGR